MLWREAVFDAQGAKAGGGGGWGDGVPLVVAGAENVACDEVGSHRGRGRERKVGERGAEHVCTTLHEEHAWGGWCRGPRRELGRGREGRDGYVYPLAEDQRVAIGRGVFNALFWNGF